MSRRNGLQFRPKQRPDNTVAMSEAGKSPSPETPIRDAACLVVIDTTGTEPTLLMGRRHADQVFLPDKWVFPGGRVEDDDRALADGFRGAFAPTGLAHEIKPFALAAVRELCEETGFLIGHKDPFTNASVTWGTFAATGYTPAPAHLLPLARAITPPGRVRRYDTWFFMANASAISGNLAMTDGELLDLGWFTFSKACDLDLPHITRLILGDVGTLFQEAQASQQSADLLPYYYSDQSAFRRDLISCKVAPPVP
jgi:8-oxo-dGTP pyrophosphatase MutT (NUDIX family)